MTITDKSLVDTHYQGDSKVLAALAAYQGDSKGDSKDSKVLAALAE